VFHRIDIGCIPNTSNTLPPAGGFAGTLSLPLPLGVHGAVPARRGPHVTILRRRARPLPPSEPAYDEIPWVDPGEAAPPWWRRVLSGTELGALVLILGVVLTIVIAVVLAASFFLLDYLIS
jgi:hypothetical protein